MYRRDVDMHGIAAGISNCISARFKLDVAGKRREGGWSRISFENQKPTPKNLLIEKIKKNAG